MPPKFGHKGEKEQVIRTQTPRRNDHHCGEKMEDKGHEMSLTRKLMLSAELWGLEATLNFEQVYLVPSLQTLEMPLSLTYLTGLVAGPCAVFLLPFVGWLVDRGSNPQCRKIAVIIIGTSLLISGILCLITANFLHLQDLLDYDSHKNNVYNASENTSVLTNQNEDFLAGDHDNLYNASVLETEIFKFSSTTSEAKRPKPSKLTNYSSTMSEGLTSAADVSQVVKNTGSYVPFKAGLGMLGFILLDIGYDLVNSLVRAFMVSCSPRAEHTSLLVLGLIMASLGGVSSAVMGLIDFTSLLGLDYIEGVGLTIQTSVQCVIVIIIFVTGILITLTTGQRQLRNLNKQNSNADTYTNTSDLIPTSDDVLTRSTMTDAFENSIRFFRGPGLYSDAPLSQAEDNDHPSSMADNAPLLSDENNIDEETDGVHLLSASVSYGAVDADTIRQDQINSPIVEEKEYVGYQKNDQPCQSSYIQNPKIKIAFVCLATFFASAMSMQITFGISDFMGKAIYKGNPFADPDSDSLRRYQEGMRMASWAFLVYFITYFVASIVHPRILAFLGYRVEFVLMHALVVATMFTVAMTTRMEAVFVLTVVSGFHRTCFFSIPFAITNDIAQSMEKSEGGGSRVGLAMSLVCSCLTLAYCLTFSWVGAVEDMVGNPSVPLYLGSAFGCLSVITFLCVGKVYSD